MHDQIVQFINKTVPHANATTAAVEIGDACVYVDAKSILSVSQALKSSPEFQFHVLQVITASDYLEVAATETTPAQEARIELSYVLASFSKNLELILKVKLPRGSAQNLPSVESVCSVWKSANWQEREAYDMMGVQFLNHPDLRRILCPDDWTGYPLRKDYVAAESYNGMVIYPEAKMNFAEREFGVRQKAETKGSVTSVENYKIGERNRH